LYHFIERTKALRKGKWVRQYYTMVETFVNAKSQRFHVYSLARISLSDEKDLELTELIVVPGAYDKNGCTPSSNNETGDMKDLDYFNNRS